MAVWLFHKLSLFTNANSLRVPVGKISAQPQTLQNIAQNPSAGRSKQVLFLQC